MPDPEEAKIYDQDAEEDGPQVEVVVDDDGNVVEKRVGLGVANELNEGRSQ